MKRFSAVVFGQVVSNSEPNSALNRGSPSFIGGLLVVLIAVSIASIAAAENFSYPPAVASPTLTTPSSKLDYNSLIKTETLTRLAPRTSIGGLDVFLADPSKGTDITVSLKCVSDQQTPKLKLDPAVYGRNEQLINLTRRLEYACSSYLVSAVMAGGDGSPQNAKPVANLIGVSIHTADLAASPETLGKPAIFAFNSVYGNWAEAKTFTPSSPELSKAFATLTEQSQRIIAGVIALPKALQADPASTQPASVNKPLEQVSPRDGYLRIDSIEPDNKGAYEVDLPLLLRPSRGPGPSFSVRYSSAGGTGVLGRGWDLNFSSIEARGPSPIYHPAYETEDYLLDGAELIALDAEGREIPPLHKGGPIIPRITGERVYRLRNNSAGYIVRRRGDGPSNYYWEVWNPNTHVTRLYGAKLQPDETIGIDRASNALLTGVVRFNGGHSATVIGQWGLSQEYDNQPARSGSSYQYERTANDGRCQSKSWDGDCWASLRLKSVNYNRAFGSKLEQNGKRGPLTGWERGATTVLFNWEERERTRFISDGRLGFFQAQEFWLKQINVTYESENNNHKWLSSANATVAEMAEKLRGSTDPQPEAAVKSAVLTSLDGKVIYSSHNFVLGGEDNSCLNFERMLKRYTVWANPLIDGPIMAAAGAPDAGQIVRDEVQTFNFDYAGESQRADGNSGCSATWASPQDIESAIPAEVGSEGGKLDFPISLIKDLGFDLLQQRSPLGTSRTKETAGSLYVGVGANDGRYQSKPTTGGILGGAAFTQTESDSTMVDVTGDGIDDIVYRSGKQLRYCAGKRGDADKFAMEYKRCGRIVGLNDISVSNTTTLSVAAEFHHPRGFASVGYNKSDNNTSVYFTDQDGDGLVDVAVRGQVLYGQGEQKAADNSEPIVRFVPRSGLIPPVPGRISPAVLQSRVPAQLRDTIRLIEARLATISQKIERLKYSQTTLSWESPLDGVVSVSGSFVFVENPSKRGAWPDDFTPAKFEALPKEVSPYAAYQAAKFDCLTWGDEPRCYEQVSDPFAPGYQSAKPAGFRFIDTPQSFLQISLFDRDSGNTHPCMNAALLDRDPGQSPSLDLSALVFMPPCTPQAAGVAKLLRVKAGDVIHVVFSVHPHFNKQVIPSIKFTYEHVDNDPVFEFLKHGATTTNGTAQGILDAIHCAWKDPGPVAADANCLLAALTRYEFDLSAGTLTSAPGARIVLPEGSGRRMRGKFQLPNLSARYDVRLDLLGVESTNDQASRVLLSADSVISSIDAQSSCAAGECTVDLNAFCSGPNPNAPCANILTEGTPYVLALRLSILHKGNTGETLSAENISSLLAKLRWSRAPAIVSDFNEKKDAKKPNLVGKPRPTVVYLPVIMGDPDLEVWRVKSGEFDNPDDGLDEDTAQISDKIDFSAIQSMEDENIEMARKRQTIDLCNFGVEIAAFLDGKISAESAPYASDYAGYWRTQFETGVAIAGAAAEPYKGRYVERCNEAREWMRQREFTGSGSHRAPVTSIDALRLKKLFEMLTPEQQVSSAQLLIERVIKTLDAGDELLIDAPKLTRRGYRLPAKINPLSCPTIASAGDPLDASLTSTTLDRSCSYRVLSNFAMLDFHKANPEKAKSIKSWFADLAKNPDIAFEVTLTATLNGKPISFRELTGAPAGNEKCDPKPGSANTCMGAYGGPERSGVTGYYYPDADDDVFQRVTVNKRTGRTVAFSNSIMQPTPNNAGLADCKRMPDYASSSDMERKQDCLSAGASSIDPSDKYVSSQPVFSITYQITEANEFLGRNRIFEFEGHPFDIVQFHFKLSPKQHADVTTVAGQTIRGKFSIFKNNAGRQMIRRSAVDILPRGSVIDCPIYPEPVDGDPVKPKDTNARLPSTCRPWTKLGWTEILLGAQYRTYSDAQRTATQSQFTIKRRRDLLRLFPEIAVDADQYSISDRNSPIPILDNLPRNELAIAGKINRDSRSLLSAILRRPGGNSAVAEAIEPQTAFLVFDRFLPHVPKIGGSWAFHAQPNDSGQVKGPDDFLHARFASEIYKETSDGKEAAFDQASAACGQANNPNFEQCGAHLREEGRESLDFKGVNQIPLIHRFTGPTFDGRPSDDSAGSACASEVPTREANCWQGFDDTILLESGIGGAAAEQSLFSMSALLGFERPPVAEFLSEFSDYQKTVCLDRDWTGSCKQPEDRLAAVTTLPGRPQAAPPEALVEIFAPVQRSESETVSFNGGLTSSDGVGSANTSRSRTNRTTLTAYQDVNGDGFPDVVSDGVAELTSPVGLPRREWWKYFRIRPATEELGKEIRVSGLAARASSVSIGAGIGLTPPTGALTKTHGTKNNTKTGSPDPNVEPSFEFNAEAGNDTDFTELRDFNGDGLADAVRGSTVNSPLKLAYNSGNSLVTSGDGTFSADGASISSAFYNTSHSAGFGVRLGYMTESGSFIAGMGLSHRDSGSQGALLDFTGDGRPDIVVPDDSGVTVYPNLGNGFGKARRHTIPGWRNQSTAYSETTLVDGGAKLTFGFGVWFVKVVFNPGFKLARNQTRELLQFRDINGDGMPDIANVSGGFLNATDGLAPVASLGELKSEVHYNPDARYHFLSGITTPTNVKFVLRQNLFGNEGPYQGKPIWALTEVARFDGFKSSDAPGSAADGQDVMLSRYHYEDGFTNRAERQFYGFAKRSMTTFGCDEDNEAPAKQNRCLALIESRAEPTDATLVDAGFKVLQKVDETFANRDVLTQGMMLSQVVRGAVSGPNIAGAAADEPVSRTVYGYSIDNLQCISDAAAQECTDQTVQSSGRWNAAYFDDGRSALAPDWDGSVDYTDNGNVFGDLKPLCANGIGKCQSDLANKVTEEGFDREQKTFWAQQSASVRQRLVRLEVLASGAEPTHVCDPDTDTDSCSGKSGLKSAVAFDHDRWGQVLRSYNIAETQPDWSPVPGSSNHTDVAYARLRSPAIRTEAQAHKRSYPLLGLATSIQVFSGGWRTGAEAPLRAREAIYPKDGEAYAGRGLPLSVCLYPGAGPHFKFEPGICRSFGANMAKALGGGMHNMQSALKFAFDADMGHLPQGGSAKTDAVIRHQLVAYDDYGNLIHTVSPLSRSLDWIERRFSYERDPFRTTATTSQVTRCVKREPGAGADTPLSKDVQPGRCTFGLETLPELVRNVPVTHYSTARVDTHSGLTAEVTDINRNSMLFDFDRWGRLHLVARNWGNAPRENKTFANLLKRAVAKSDFVDGDPDAARGPPDVMVNVSDWRILALAAYSCVSRFDDKQKKVLETNNCRSTPSSDGRLRSNVRRFEAADTYTGLLQAGNTTRESAAFTDGLGRVIQTQVEADVCLQASLLDGADPKNVAATDDLRKRCSNPDTAKPSVATVIVRPSPAVDVLGRELMSFEPYAPGNDLAARIDSRMRLEGALVSASTPLPLTRSTYDGAGRPLKVESRLAAPKAGGISGTTQFSYRIRDLDNAPSRFEALSMSPRCSASAVWTDARGLTTSVFEGQATRYIEGPGDSGSGKLPVAGPYARRLDRTAEACKAVADLPADWAASAVRTDYTYDPMQQLRRVDYPTEGSPPMIWADYDLLGRTVQMQDRNSGCTSYSYDALNLLTSEIGYRFDQGDFKKGYTPICGATFQAHNEKTYVYSADRLKTIAYHSLDEQGGVADQSDKVTFHYDRYPYAALFGAPVEADKYVLNDQANQHLIDVSGRHCDNCIGQATLVSDRSGARTFSYNELGLVRREIRSIVGPLEHVVKSGGQAETYAPEIASYEAENSYSAYGDLVLEKFSESAPANPAEACVANGVDTCLARFTIGRRYSPDGTLAELRFNGKTIVSSAQDALGRPAVRWTANGSTTGYRYDPKDLRLNQLATLTAGNQPVQMVGYQYDGDGNILDYVNGSSKAADYRSAFAFTYDPANRLRTFSAGIDAQFGGAARSMQSSGHYDYDQRHRFTCRKLNITENGKTFARSWSYAYDPINRPFHAPRSVSFLIGGESNCDAVLMAADARKTEFVYDEIGRMTGAGAPGDGAKQPAVPGVISNRTMSWDGQGRLISVNGLDDKAANDNAKWLRERYAYDAGGNRVLKLHQPDVLEPASGQGAAGTTNEAAPRAPPTPRKFEAATIYMTPYYARPYDARGTVQLSTGAAPAVSMAAPADESEDPLSTYLYADLPAGSMTAAVTAYGEAGNFDATLIARREYDPYGLPLTSEALAQASRADLPALNVFHGKELDRVTGFSLFGARYYSRDAGIWLSPDPAIKAPSFGKTDLVAFSFASRNPVKFTDAQGMSSTLASGAPNTSVYRRIEYMAPYIIDSAARYGVGAIDIAAIVYQEKKEGIGADLKDLAGYLSLSGRTPDRLSDTNLSLSLMASIYNPLLSAIGAPSFPSSTSEWRKASFGPGEMQLQRAADLLGVPLGPNDLPNLLQSDLWAKINSVPTAMDLVAKNLQENQSKLMQSLTPQGAGIAHNRGWQGFQNTNGANSRISSRITPGVIKELQKILDYQKSNIKFRDNLE